MTTYYWSARKGQFMDKTTGTAIEGKSFTGTKAEWNETLFETIFDIRNRLGKKFNEVFLTATPKVFKILQGSVMYRDNTLNQMPLNVEPIREELGDGVCIFSNSNSRLIGFVEVQDL